MAQQANGRKLTAAESAVDEAVTAAIKTAETRSSAEIAVAILPRGDHYTLTAVMAALLTFAILHTVLGWVDFNALLVPSEQGSGAWLSASSWLGTVIALAAAVLIFLLCIWSRLGVWLTPSQQQHQACLAHTKLVFWDQHLDTTADRLGLLICIYEAERRIDILPDRGITALVSDELWHSLIERFRQHKQRGSLEAALAELVTTVADELAAHFPPRADQVNELPDGPMRLA